MDIDPCFGRGPGKAARVVERVQVSRAAIHQAAVKSLRRHFGVQCRAVQHLDLLVPVAGSEMIRFAGQRAGVARPVGGDGDAWLQVAFDPVAGDELAHERLRLLGKRPKQLRGLFAELALQGELIAPVPAAELPAVAAGGAVADAPCFEQHRAIAVLGEMERAGEPGIAAADDADVRAHVAIERGPGGVRPCARLVPGGRSAVVLGVAACPVRRAHHTASRRNLRSQELTTRR